MGDFKLPEIAPIPVDRQPGMFDRMGSQINQALQQVASVPFEMDKSKIIADNAAAAADVAAAKVAAEQYQRENKYANVQQLQDQFGPDLPESLRLAPDGTPRQGPIPVHEYGPQLYKLKLDQAISEAAGKLDPNWRARFTESQRMDAIPDIAKVQAHATEAQQMDRSLGMLSSYESLIASGKYPEALVVAQQIPNDTIRNATVKGHDDILVKSEVALRIRRGTDEELAQAKGLLQQGDKVDIKGRTVPVDPTLALHQISLIDAEQHRRAALGKTLKEEAWKVPLGAVNAKINEVANDAVRRGITFGEAEAEYLKNGGAPLDSLVPVDPNMPPEKGAEVRSQLKIQRDGGYRVDKPGQMGAWARKSEKELASLNLADLEQARKDLPPDDYTTVQGWVRAARLKKLEGKELSDKAIIAEMEKPEFLSNTIVASNMLLGTKVDPATPYIKLDIPTRIMVDDLRTLGARYRVSYPNLLTHPLNAGVIASLKAKTTSNFAPGDTEQIMVSAVDTSGWHLIDNREKVVVAKSLVLPLPGLLTGLGLHPGADALKEHTAEIVNVEMPLFDAAWKKTGETGPVPPQFRLDVHEALVRMRKGQLTLEAQKALAQIETAGNKNPTETDLIRQLVWNLPPQDSGSRAKANEEAVREGKAANFRDVSAEADAKIAALPKWKQEIYKARDSEFKFQPPPGYAADLKAAQAVPDPAFHVQSPANPPPAMKEFESKWSTKDITARQKEAFRTASDAEIAAYEKFLVDNGDLPARLDFSPRVSFDSWRRYHKGKN